MKFDFGGWATKNDLRCSDGRIIRHGAFKDCDGMTVPLVWQHLHDSPDNILGHALLENRSEGVYAYCSFNDSQHGRQAKEIVKHGDIGSLSIYANQLRQKGNEVLHGAIREVSLVLSGANPGALIDNLSFSHSDGTYETIDDEAIIYTGIPALAHADDQEEESADDEKTIQEIFDTLTEEQKQAVYAIIGLVIEDAASEDAASEDEGETVAHADGEEATVQEIFDTLTEEQKQAVYAIIGAVVEEDDQNDEADEDGSVEHSYHGKGVIMKHNVFEGLNQDDGTYLTHADVAEIFSDAKRIGSLKEAVLQHGITDIDVMFPEAQAVANQPSLISRNMEWVAGVLNSVRKSPFSKVKSTAANLTADEARAKGYLNQGTQKVEEQISALKRVTPPTTVYKLQKLDRDDVVDITDFDVVAWLKAEMRTMLDEELARAILVGDGRLATSNEKINEQCIRPIWTDEETYTVHTKLTSAEPADIVDAFIRARNSYRGSGSPTLYIGPSFLTTLRLMRNKIGERLYKNDQELADELRVSKIVEVEILDSLSREEGGTTYDLVGIVVNLNDYNVGASKGGEVTMFDDFDLDYNKLEYLIETRCSGALVTPKSALVVEIDTDAATNSTGDGN